MALVRAVAATMRLARGVHAPRSMSTLAAELGEVVEFPRVARGLNYDLNWSLAGDQLTTRGEAFRNPTVRDLIEFAPRGVRVTKNRAVVATAGQAAAAPTYATDHLPGTSVVDIEDFERRIESVRSESLSYAPRLFVTDGALAAGSRASELRVRFVTDCPLVALASRALLHRIPLYAPEAFPRTLTVYAATLAAQEGVAAGASLPGASASASGGRVAYSMVDVDPQAARGTVTSVGAVPLAGVFGAIATAAGALQAAGGYRHIPGGSAQSPSMNKARADGMLDWYLHDGHYYAPAGEPHPDLLPLQADIVTGSSSGAPTIVIGDVTGAVAAAAATAGRLGGAHSAVWHASEGVTAQWAGLLAPASSALGSAVDALPRGAVSAYGAVAVPLSALPRRLAHPGRVIVVGGKGTDAAALAAAAALRPKASEKLAARLAAAKPEVVAVATAAEAIKAAGLA